MRNLGWAGMLRAMGMAVVIGSRNVAVGAVALLATLALISPVWVGEATHVAQISGTQAGVAYAHLPLAFEPNLGQFDRNVRYVARGSGYSLLLTRRSVVLNLTARHSRRAPIGFGDRSATASAATASIALTGANPDARLSAESVLPGRVNYLVGTDRSRWRTNVPTYARVRDENVWPGIDALFYGRDGAWSTTSTSRPVPIRPNWPRAQRCEPRPHRSARRSGAHASRRCRPPARAAC